MTAVLEAKTLSKWFGEVVAVNNLDLVIGTGVTGLLGPNGAGKTTFIKLALGLYRPSRGELLVWGEKPRNNLHVLARIGYCPESDTFYESMTGYEFVYWLNRGRGMSRNEAIQSAEEALDRVHMTERMDDPISAYSRGMRQRIKIAQALAGNPDLLFLDEPLAGLDPEGREEMYALVRRLGEEGRTIVVSSHILYEIERVTNQVALIHQGRILARGAVRDIRELIDEHPHAVTILCEEPRMVAAQFVEDASTLSIEFCNGAVTVRTRDPNHFYQKLNGLIASGALTVSDIRCPDDDLQSVFQYLVR